MNNIAWSTAPSNMFVRARRDLMVHRVLELRGDNVIGETVLLECGFVIPRNETTEITDPVDCMACMLRRTSEAMEVEFADYERVYNEGFD